MTASSRRPIPVTLVVADRAEDAAGLAEAFVSAVGWSSCTVIAPPGLVSGHAVGSLVELDEEVVERSDGCPCCAYRHDLSVALPELAAGRAAPQRLVVVGSPAADPAVVLRTLLGDPLVSRTIELDAVITMIDGPTASVRAATDQPLGGHGLGEHRVLLADRLVLGRATLLSETGLDAVAWGLREMNRFARICVPALDGIRPESLVDVGTHRAGAVAARLRAHRPFRPSAGDGLAQALVRVEGRLDPDGLEEWCHDLVRTHAPRLLRVEGAFSLRGTPSRAVLLGSGSTTAFRLLTDRDDAEEPLESRVLLVAGDIEHDRLEAALAATARP